MKIGYSSLACPTWDLETIVSKAAEYGYDGVELRHLRGQLHLPLSPELAADPNAVRSLFASRKVELVCLGSSATLDSKKPKDIARNKQALTEYIELAGRLGCPFVRFLLGEVQRWDNHRAALSRVTEAVVTLAPVAASHGVTLLVENSADFPSASDLWFVVDAANHPAVRACWSQCIGLTARERATNSIPRLGRMIGMVNVCDGTFDPSGVLLEYRLPGQGEAEVDRMIEILRGLAYDEYLMFEWPKLWVDSLASPEQALPATAKFLRAELAKKQAVLTAYKGDKNAPRFRPVSAAPA